jgi:hypothetical protein
LQSCNNILVPTPLPRVHLVLELVEALLHIVVPFVTLRAVGLDWKRALLAPFVASTSDLGSALPG